jgi:hypothetical protein
MTPQGSPVVFSGECIELKYTTISKWERCGLYYETSVDELGGHWMELLVPHWLIVVPLWGLSALLLMPRRGIANVPPAAMAKSVGFFVGWRRKLGVAALLMAFVLIAGGVRGGIMTDDISLPMGAHSQLTLASGKDGITWHCDGSYGGYPPSYRVLTGSRHERFSFRPHDPLAGLSGDEAVNVLTHMFNTSGEAAAPAPLGGVTGATTAPAPVGGMEIPDAWSGMTFQWSGLYLSRSGSPADFTLVVPYGFLAIPTAVLALTLLCGSRPLRPFEAALVERLWRRDSGWNATLQAAGPSATR